MKLTCTPHIITQNNVDRIQSKSITGKEQAASPLASCVSVKNSPESIRETNHSRDKAANVLKNFLRKTIAAQSYGEMFSQGTYFKILDTELAKPAAPKHSFRALDHLNALSRNYLSKIEEKTQNLTSQEQDLLRKVVDTKIHFRHQSNSNLADETLNIKSHQKLQFDSIQTGKNTFADDIKCLSNQDFVFFGVEFSEDLENLPVHTLHTEMDFGANAYIVDDQFPYGYLTLTDHYFNKVLPAHLHEHQDFVNQFAEVRKEVFRKVHGDKGPIDIPIYNTKDMRRALGLHLINFLRQSKDEGFKNFVLNSELNSKDLDKVLNFVFQPEFHVPRMVSTTDFKYVKLREMNLKEAIKASNLTEISSLIKSKDDACSAMEVAIKNAKRDVVEFLFSAFSFTRDDVPKMSSRDDIEYLLSDCDGNADEEILKAFLERGLIDPNKPFVKVNAGDTMLDNAVKFGHKSMIALLQAYGAKGTEELPVEEAEQMEI